MPVPLLSRKSRQAWSRALDRRLGGLPFDWRLLAPFFLAGYAAGLGGVLWFLVFVAGPMV